MYIRVLYHKESERGKGGDEEDSVKKIRETTRATFIASYKKLIDTNLDRQKVEYKCHLDRFLKKKLD